MEQRNLGPGIMLIAEFNLIHARNEGQLRDRAPHESSLGVVSIAPTNEEGNGPPPRRRGTRHLHHAPRLSRPGSPVPPPPPLADVRQELSQFVPLGVPVE